MGGQDAVYAFRQELMAGRPFAEGGAVQVNVVPGFANGGAVWQGLWDIVSKRFPNARLTSAQSGRSGGQHAAGKAIDVGGSVPYPNATGKREMLEINRWIADEYGASTRALIHTPGINLLNGKPHTYDAPTRAGHHNHVHWDANGIPKRGGGFLDTIGGWVGGAVDWVTDWINDRLADIASGLATPARALVDAIPMNAPPEIMGLPKKVGYKIIDSAVDWFTKRANDEGGKKRDADTGGGGAEGADSSVVDTVSNVFNTRGWGIGSIDWSAVDWIVNKESGWNPRAQNPVSTASGLFQHINSTWNAYKRPGTTASRMRDASVSQQAYAGMNYISKAYGTPLNARGFWQRNGWYDDGGWLPPGHTSVYNGTSKPEAVFTNEQWATLEANLRNNGGGADDPYSGPMIGEVNLYGAQDPQDAISELGWEARRMSRGGVFTGGRR